jgi:predicted alpha/beta hydrolase family esterase
MTVLILHGIQGSPNENWFPWLKGQLEKKGHTVLLPELPESDNPDRKDWLKTVTDILLKTSLDDLVIVGHSLGVVTALDFLENAKAKVNALISVSGFAYDYGSSLNAYFLKERIIDFKKVKEHLRQAFVIYGDNDPYVSQEALKSLAENLEVTPKVIPNGGHVNSTSGFTSFPYIVEIIDGLE